jgi:hypothetical protein
MNSAVSIEAGFARAVISPPPGVALAGYFNPRYNRGILDELYVRACLFRSGDEVMGLVQLDLLEATQWMCAAIRNALRSRGMAWADSLIIGATHTHTGPEPRAARDERHHYALDCVVTQAVHAVECAFHALAPSELARSCIVNNPFAFNRRFWMKDGSVVTNPGKLNPDIVRPEGVVDRDLGVIHICQAGRLVGLIVNVVNHTDTIGGDLVSADWPGFLERRIQQAAGSQVPVMVLVGASGNINHFDVTSGQDQTCYDEARRIGEGYADIILRSFDDTVPVPAGDIECRRTVLPIRKRSITDEQRNRARELLAGGPEDDGVFTSEDLARGAAPVLRYFARQLLNYDVNEAGQCVDFELTALCFADDLAIVSLPGEPFTEIGIAVKKASPFRQTLVVSNANGYAGYIVFPESLEHGGYEPLPVESGGADPAMAKAMTDAASRLLQG